MCCALIMAATAATADKKAPPNELLRGASSPAWSLRANQSEMIVAVSPARQTLQILGSTGAVLGTGISAVVNDKYGRQIREVLQDYDAGKVFEEHIAARLSEVLGESLKQVSGLGSTAGYNSVRDAEKVRFASIGKSGHEYVLDLKMTYGLFGFEGALIAKLEGSLYETPSGHRKWNDVLVCSSSPILASDRLTDPTKMLSANFSSPRLSVDENAISQWTGDGGAELRKRFEAALHGVTSALLTGLGLVDESDGHYYLGQVAMNRKKFDIAADHFKKSFAIDPANTAARNGLSVDLAHNKQVDEAITLAAAILENEPEFGPTHYNLAWWYAVEKKDAEAARPHYEKALAMGYPAEKKVEKVLNPKKK